MTWLRQWVHAAERLHKTLGESVSDLCPKSDEPGNRAPETEPAGGARTDGSKIWSGMGLRAAQNVFTLRGLTSARLLDR